MTEMEIYMAAGSLAVLCLVYLGIRFYRHQCLLRDRAHLMREAVRNRDFTFRLPLRANLCTHLFELSI